MDGVIPWCPDISARAALDFRARFHDARRVRHLHDFFFAVWTFDFHFFDVRFCMASDASYFFIYFHITKPLILLTKTGLPNKSVQLVNAKNAIFLTFKKFSK